MATITQTKAVSTALESPKFELDVGGWLKNSVFNSIWKTLFAVVLIVLNVLIVRATYRAEPIELSSVFAPNGEPTAIGQLILALSSTTFLTSIVLILWVIGLIAVVYSATTNHWPGLTRWLKDSLYTGFFSSLTTLALSLLIIFAIRSVLAWAIFGAEFNADPDAASPATTPGAVWGIVLANLELFAVGRYPSALVWRPWASLGLVLLLAILSILAWNFGSPLKRFRQPLVWAWLASLPIIYFFLAGLPNQTSGPLRNVGTNLWGGFLLTMVISVLGIVVSFPIGLLLALGRRSQARGVPWLWLWGILILLAYWAFGNFPDGPVTLNIPLIFREPPLRVVTLSPISYAALQVVGIVGIFWIVDYYLQGNLIKTFSIVYIELIRGVPLITVLFMANILIPIFLPKGLDIDNLLRVIIGIILFSAAYLAENVRGGLQAIPMGQYEAAAAIGLSTAQSMRLIILPQALRAVIPAIVGQFISLFKDTSLVAIVGLLDLLKIAQVVQSQPDWLGLYKESFVFVALIYWICAFSMSTASRRLERKLGIGRY